MSLHKKKMKKNKQDIHFIICDWTWYFSDDQGIYSLTKWILFLVRELFRKTPVACCYLSLLQYSTSNLTFLKKYTALLLQRFSLLSRSVVNKPFMLDSQLGTKFTSGGGRILAFCDTIWWIGRNPDETISYKIASTKVKDFLRSDSVTKSTHERLHFSDIGSFVQVNFISCDSGHHTLTKVTQKTPFF